MGGRIAKKMVIGQALSFHHPPEGKGGETQKPKRKKN
jgi:hypothetical protein